MNHRLLELGKLRIVRDDGTDVGRLMDVRVRAKPGPVERAESMPVDALLIGSTGWLERMRSTKLYAYRMRAECFEPWDKFFISRETVVPLEVVELGDLLARHAKARNELRIAPALYPLWDEVIETTLDFSGIRLRNAVRP